MKKVEILGRPGGAIIVDSDSIVYDCKAVRRNGLPSLTEKTVTAPVGVGLESLSQLTDAQLAILTVGAQEHGARRKPEAERVAMDFNDAQRLGESAREMLAASYGAATSSASRWIAQARQEGHLAQAKGNRGRPPAASKTPE